MNCLRLTQGVPTKLFQQRTGLPLHTVEPLLEQLVADSLLDQDYHHVLRTTAKGSLYLNDVLQFFM